MEWPYPIRSEQHVESLKSPKHAVHDEWLGALLMTQIKSVVYSTNIQGNHDIKRPKAPCYTDAKRYTPLTINQMKMGIRLTEDKLACFTTIIVYFCNNHSSCKLLKRPITHTCADKSPPISRSMLIYAPNTHTPNTTILAAHVN